MPRIAGSVLFCLFGLSLLLPEGVCQKQGHARPHEGEHPGVNGGKFLTHAEDAEEELDGGINVH